MAIGTLFGSSPESSGLYGIATGTGSNPTIISQTYFEWFIFITSAGTPATPTGGSWDFNTNTGTAPAGWSNFISGVPLNSLWFSVAFVDSRNPTVITWTSPGLISSQSVYATAYADVFTGNGSTVAWTLTQDPVVVNNTDVSINGVTQVPGTDYTLSGTTLTTTTAAPLNAIILVKYRQALPLSYYGAASNVQFTPVGALTATNVQAAITEVVTDLALSSGSSTVGFLQAGAGAVATNVQAKLRQYVSVKDFGAVGNGVTDDTAAIQLAINNNQGVFFPEGSYLISSPIQLTQQWVYGVGSDKSIILCSATHAFTVLSNAGFDRPACVVEKLGINSVSNSCDDKFAFYVPGVASGAAAVYNIGLTIRDVEIGRTGRMGGGFYLKDLFRCNIEDVGLTDVSRMIQVVGSVVQLRASRVLSNNDSAGTTLTRYGISTESASYSSGTLGPENCVFDNCTYIRGSRGINHTSGLMIYFTNFDTEADAYGALVGAQCTIQGGIFAPGIAASSWTGIYRSSGVSEAYDGTYFVDVDVNTLRVPSIPASSFGFDFGDGTSPVFGVIMQNCRVRGTPNSVNHAIRGRQCRDAIIEGTSIESAICSGTEVLFTLARGLNFNFNRVVGGIVDITDDGDTTATGSVLNNQVGTMALSLTFPTSNNWIVSGNGTTSVTRGFGITVDTSGYKFLNLPTSSAGLPSGALWNDSGAVKVV